MVFIKSLESFFIVTFSAITLCIYFMIFSINPIILYVCSTEYRLSFNETFEFWQKSVSCGIFSCFNKSKSLAGKISKEPAFVIAFSMKNKGCEEN